MRYLVAGIALLGWLDLSAQAKTAPKRIKLPVKNDKYEVRMQYSADVLYFTKPDLINYIEKEAYIQKNFSASEVIKYLNLYRGDLKLATTDTVFPDLHQRNLHKILLWLGPQMLADGKACDEKRKTHTFNPVVFLKPCPDKPDQNEIYEAPKGRLIFGCPTP